MYDLSTKKETRITNSKNASHPVIYDNKIVWSDKRVWNDNKFEKYNIHMYDLTTHKETQITSSGSAQDPSIYNNKIVWLDYRHDNSDSEWEYPDVYMYDLTTNKETRITTYKSYKCCPYIYGNSIGWHDQRDLPGNGIYLYDISTHQEIHSKTPYGAPIIYGNKMVWVDNRNDDDGDVYMGVFSYLPIAAFTASSTSGKYPMNVKFIDKSTDAYYWNWNFGDKTTSTLQSPTHKYTKAGKYTVTLTVKNAAGSNTMKKTNYITIK